MTTIQRQMYRATTHLTLSASPKPRPGMTGHLVARYSSVPNRTMDVHLMPMASVPGCAGRGDWQFLRFQRSRPTPVRDVDGQAASLTSAATSAGLGRT